MNVVVATAGHVDHGKSALIRALTGTNPDRLPEERRREMTIVIGYAYLRLPDGSELDFVDVPGHEDFLGNMIVGAAEADTGLLVVAADEGIRQQTREHVQVLDALCVAPLAVAITKVDLLPQRGLEREQRIAELTGATRALVGSPVPVVAVSALTGEGLDDLVRSLTGLQANVLARSTPRPPEFARMAIDRAFLIRGRGLVVTGTVRGQLKPGENVRLMPGGAHVRVRELQVHGEPVDRASDCRVAANLAGVGRDGVHRGMVIDRGGATDAVDHLFVSLDKESAQSLDTARQAVRVHLSTGEAMARIRRLASVSDGRAIASLSLDRSLAAAPGDPFVLRRPSPAVVIGGGRVIDTRVPHVRPAAIPLADAEALVAESAPRRRLVALLRLHGAIADPHMRWLLVAHGLRWESNSEVLEVGEFCASEELVARAMEALAAAVAEYATPLKGGLPVGRARSIVSELVRRRTALSVSEAESLGVALVDRLHQLTGSLVTEGVILPAELPESPPAIQQAIDHLAALLDSPTPPSVEAAVQLAGCTGTAIDWLERSGRIRRLSDKVALSVRAYGEMEVIARRLAQAGPVTPAAFRDAAGTTRRFALAVLEDLDRRGVLRRSGHGHELAERGTGESRTVQ